MKLSDIMVFDAIVPELEATTRDESIAELVKAVQETAAEAVGAMDEGTAEVSVGVARANEAGQSLASILIATEDVRFYSHKGITWQQRKYF